MSFLLMAVILLTFVGCTDEDGATKALVHAGYQPIEVGGYAWFGYDETFRTEFTAVAKNGDTIDGVVTSGWFKGSTIRTND